MTVRYARAPSESFLALFRDGGLLHALTEPLACMVGGQPVWLDLQFRKSDEAMLYCGQTRLLVVSMQRDSVRVSAHRTYREQPAAKHLLGRWPASESGSVFETALSQYLSSLQVALRWTQSEGAVQARWMMNDPSVNHDVPWTSIDREAVLTYADDIAPRPQLETAREAASLLAREEGWAQPSVRAEGNELDQLAISSDGRELVLIELKPRNGGKAFYSPLQLAGYAFEWAAALSGPSKAAIVRDLNSIVDAKRTSGLIGAAHSLSDSPVIRPVIGFNNPPSREALRRMPMVWNAISESVAHPLILHPEIWAWPDGSRPYKVVGL